MMCQVSNTSSMLKDSNGAHSTRTHSICLRVKKISWLLENHQKRIEDFVRMVYDKAASKTHALRTLK